MPLPLARAPRLLRVTGFLILALLVGSGWSASASKRAIRKDAKRQIEDLEGAWRDAQISGNVAEMDKILSEDYFGITMTGQVTTKAQQLDRIRRRTMVLSKIDLSDVKVKLIGSTAIVTSRAEVEGVSDGAPMRGSFRYTRVYQRTLAGQWKITNFEATRMARGANPAADRGPDEPRP